MITHDVDEAILLADRILLMTQRPARRLAEIVANTLPRERRARRCTTTRTTTASATTWSTSSSPGRRTTRTADRRRTRRSCRRASTSSRPRSMPTSRRRGTTSCASRRVRRDAALTMAPIASDVRPPLPPFTRDGTEKVQKAEDAWNSRDPDRCAAAYTEDSVWRNRSDFFRVVPRSVPSSPQVGARARLPAEEGALELHRQPHLGALRLRVPRRLGPLVARARQRAVGVRRARPHAPPRSQHQRRRDRRERAEIPLAARVTAPSSRPSNLPTTQEHSP